MGRRPDAPLPTRGEVEEAVRQGMTRHPADAGVDATAIRYDIRMMDAIKHDGVERVAVGYEMHRDDMARPCFAAIDPKEGDWRGRLDRSMTEIAMHVARLEARRATFDPHRTGVRTPRRAWDIHPIAASILSLYPRIPDLDGTHRIDGAVGRVVRLGRRPGLNECIIAYGDGVVRIAEATFEGGANLTQRGHETLLRIPGSYPGIVKAALKGASPARVADMLGADPRSAKTNVVKVAEVGDGAIELTFANRLVPWDRRARGGESWRLGKLAA